VNRVADRPTRTMGGGLVCGGSLLGSSTADQHNGTPWEPPGKPVEGRIARAASVAYARAAFPGARCPGPW
jgi:hypothetical protein